MRRRLYTEHKYVSFRLSEFSRFVATADFTQDTEVAEVKRQFEGIKALMLRHAEHENNSIHPLLAAKGSSVFRRLELDHTHHATVFAQLDTLLDATMGHDFCLVFLRFEADNLVHQDFEETQLLPELYRLYTDAEILAQVDGPVYAAMMTVLFPHFNRLDRQGMLNDIRLAQPEKFLQAWEQISPMLEKSEQANFADTFGLPSMEQVV